MRWTLKGDAEAARRMNPWNLYVFGKLALQWFGYIRIELVPELAGFVVIYALTRRAAERLWVRAAIGVFGTVLAVVLFWRASFLPAPPDAMEFVLDNALRPDRTYFLSFLKGLTKRWEVWGAVAAAAALFHFRHRKVVDLTAPSLAALLAFAAFWPRPDSARLTADKASFYAAEAQRRVSLPKPAADFDLVFVHVCSMSWDDLWKTGLAGDSLLGRFDLLFTRFNSVSSYSEQAAIRLLRATCGQPRYAQMYKEAPPECYLKGQLERAGYHVETAMNHSGAYLEMSAKLARWGHLRRPMPVADLLADKVNFNGTAVYDDYEVLERWWKKRQASGAKRAALYYNTVSLHAGAHPVGEKRAWSKDPAERFRISAVDLFADLQRFFGLLEASGRNVVVVLIPEHGGAVRGSQFLLPGMRDMVLPAIALVPVGVKLFGAAKAAGGPRLVTAPVSYLGLAHLLGGLMARPPFGPKGASLDETLAGLPETRHVEENRTMVLLGDKEDFYLDLLDRKWITLPRKFHPDRVRTR